MYNRRAFTFVVNFICVRVLFNDAAVPFTKTQGLFYTYGEGNEATDDISLEVRAYQKQLPIVRHEGQMLEDVSDVISTNCLCLNVSLDVPPCRTVTNRSADCSCCGLKEVPKLSRPETIVELNFSCNSLPDDSLHENVFAHFSNLKVLDLSGNGITRLPEGVFNGLSQLQYLNLKWNHILMNQQLNISNVFQPLISLQTLILNKNNHISLSNPHLVYPEYALSSLGNLSELHLDGLADKSFGELFSKLTGLRNLQLAGWREGNCNLSSLYNNTFQYVSAITQLNIADCHLNKDFLQWGAFSPLVNLASLDISNNFGLSLKVIGELMYGLRNNKNFRHLRMQRIVTRFSPCVVVYKEYLKYFEEMGLETLDASYNEIVMIEEGALQVLPRTLKRINLMGNIIMFGAYLSDLDSLTNLTELSLDRNFGEVEAFPTTLPSGDIKCGENQKREEGGKRKYSVSEPSPDGSLHLSLPPELKTLSMKFTNLAYAMGGISFFRNNSLEEAYLQGNVFRILRGPITGLEKLVRLDLSDCFINDIDETFFNAFPSLEYLNLFQNLLGDSFNEDKTGKTFSSMGNLTHLNISFNNIYHFNETFFSGTPNLQTLDLTRNRVRLLNFDISPMKNLTSLLLAANDISVLADPAMRHIDDVLNSKRSFSLDLRFNPIACNCDTLPFLEWLVRNKRILVGPLDEYNCVFKDASSKNLTRYDETVSILRRQCPKGVTLIVFVSCGTAAVLVFLVLTIAYRYRWSLRYWYHAVKLMTASKRQASSHAFDFDAFICYAHTDEDFIVEYMLPELSTQRGVNLMIHGQSFKAGRLIIDNILMAVRRCRKTVVVVTKSMLESKWCLYELQMARMESINTGRSVLIFVFLENIAYKDIKHDIVSYIRTNSVTAYPPGQRQRKVFWDKLAHDIKDVS